MWKDRRMNIERIFPYYAEHDVAVEAPETRDLEPDAARQPTSEHAPPRETPQADDDDDDEPIDDGYPHPSLRAAPSVLGPSPYEEPPTAPETEQDQQPEVTDQPAVPSDTDHESTAPAEPMSERRYPQRNRNPTKRLISELLAYIGRIPGMDAFGRRSSVTGVN
jgi:hypothetical protein